jgi:tRNA 2-selenouridine synthase
MPLHRVDIGQAIARLAAYDAVVDARSPAEFAEDHLPGAANWPTLDDEQRRLVGTQYKQVSAFEARKRGAALAARNIAAHIERELPGTPRQWKALVYCWRGGQRSGALAHVLAQIGFAIDVLDGGYREFRRRVVADLERAGDGLALQVVCGTTGTGKSRLLAALARAGTQVLDLEALAMHRGSVLGALPQAPQPSQKHFETRLWDSLRGFDRARPVFVESESRTIGRLRLPEALLARMRAAACVRIEMPLAARIALLVEDYAHLVRDPDLLCDRLASLREARGAAVVERWCALAREGRIEELVGDLLADHYDPIYQRSMARNFEQFERARVVDASDGDAATLDRVAATMLPVAPHDPAPPAAQGPA